MTLLIVSCVFLAAIAVAMWLLPRAMESPRDQPSPRPPPPTLSAMPEGLGGSRPPPRISSNNPPALPSFVEDDDIIEITVVEAAPESEPPEPAGLPHTRPTAEASTIEVLYEDDAAIEEVTAPMARILISAQGQSDIGNVRRRNEDSLLVFPEQSIFVVADGMGGHVGGDIASALAVETVRRSFERSVFDGRIESKTVVPRRGRELACAIQMANQAVLERATVESSLAQMGTTLVVARFSPAKQRVYVGNVGDSRCYRLRRGALRQLTKDHTMAQLGLKGRGAEHLFQAVGLKPKILIDIVVDIPRTNDIYMLCSDGLSKMASDEEICDVLCRHEEVDAAVQALIQFAKDKGGRDNVTVILVKVVDRAADRRATGIVPRGVPLR
jgi:serine/threonine protein phosphatase PrpC